MELHELYLAQGSTTLNTTMNHATIKHYLKVASSISLRHKILDPLVETRGLEVQCIKEVKRWESMPNLRETFTVKIVLHTHKKWTNKYPDSIKYIACDCIALGILYGFRLSEWTQSALDNTQLPTGTCGLLLAFIFPIYPSWVRTEPLSSIHSRIDCTTTSSNSYNSYGEHRKPQTTENASPKVEAQTLDSLP